MRSLLDYRGACLEGGRAEVRVGGRLKIMMGLAICDVVGILHVRGIVDDLSSWQGFILSRYG